MISCNVLKNLVKTRDKKRFIRDCDCENVLTCFAETVIEMDDEIIKLKKKEKETEYLIEVLNDQIDELENS
jgi:hypothetical protein